MVRIIVSEKSRNVLAFTLPTGLVGWAFNNLLKRVFSQGSMTYRAVMSSYWKKRLETYADKVSDFAIMCVR